MRPGLGARIRAGLGAGLGAGLVVAPLWLPAIAQAEPAVLLSGGLLLAGSFGPHPAVGPGLEVSVPIFPDRTQGTGFGPLYQMSWQGDDRARRMVGLELFHLVSGMEFGWSDRRVKGESLQGIHLGPFFTVGVGSVGLRVVVPTKGEAFELGLGLTLKLPIPVYSDPNFINLGGHGRPLRAGGLPVRAAVCVGARRPAVRGLPQHARSALAQAWIEDALEEHASVANFELLARHLGQHGAPEALVGLARAAAHDEADHAQRCFDVAGALLGRRLRAAPIPVPEGPPADLTILAVEGLGEGELGEEVAAQCAEIAANSASPTVGHHLKIIARDEARHAWLSGLVRRWAEGVGGAEVRHAVANARAELPLRLPPRPEPEGALARRWGRLPAAQHAEVFARVRAQLPA